MTGELTKEELLFKHINDGDAEAALQLLDEGELSLDCEDKEGMTPLSAAAYKGQQALVEYLIGRGADVNTKAHKHGYSPLMFAALAGKPDLCRILMDAGAYAEKTNTINKSASELAAFVGQHECVTVINNHVSIDTVEKFLHPKGEESEEIFPKDFVQFVHRLASSHKVHPVAVAFLLRDNAHHLVRRKKILYAIDRVFEHQLRSKEPNEVMSMKLWLVLSTVREVSKLIEQNAAKGTGGEKSATDICTLFAKQMVKQEPDDKVRMHLDRHLRACIVGFPYHQSLLFETMVRAMAKTTFGEPPPAYDYIVQALFGQRAFAMTKFCWTCGTPGAKKRCGTCKTPYCSQECQKFDWTVHKKMCSTLVKTRLMEAQDSEDSPRGTVEEGEREETEERAEKAEKVGDTVDENDAVSIEDVNVSVETK